MPEKSSSPRAARSAKACSPMPGSLSPRVKPEIDERAVEAPLKDSGATPEDVALVLATAKAAEVSERNPQALVIGSDQTLSLGDEIFHKPADMEGARRHLLAPVRKDASAEQRRRARPRRRNAVVACRRRPADDARARAGFHRPLSGARRRQGAVERRRLSDRGRGHPAVRKDRRRLFHHRRPAACCRCSPHFASWARSMAERSDRGLCLRPSDRPFALADDPWPLAEGVWVERQLPRHRYRAGRLCRTSWTSCRGRALPAATSRSRTRRRLSPASPFATKRPSSPAPSTRFGSRTGRSAAATPTSTALPPISTSTRRNGERPSGRSSSAPAAPRAPSCSRCSRPASARSASPTARPSVPWN